MVCVVVGSGDDPVPCSSLRAPLPGVAPAVSWLSLLVLPDVPAIVEPVPVSPARTIVASVPAAAAVLAPAKSTTHFQNEA